MKAVLIPVKEPNRAKKRLAPYLSSKERRDLQWAMLTDVSHAVSRARRADRIVVVTSSEEVRKEVISRGFEVIREEEQSSESLSIDFASRLLKREGVSEVLRLPVDIPLIQPEDVDSLLSLDLRSGAAALVPSREGTGTNALLRHPPDAFSSHFGKNSFERHRWEARRQGIRLKVVENLRVALDLDELSDVVYFLRVGVVTRTTRALRRFESLKNLAV